MSQQWIARGEFFPPGDCSGKLHECSAVFSLAGVSTPPVYSLGMAMPWSSAFHPFKSENSAGRIKIKLLGRILLHGSSPDIFVCLDY